MRCAIAIGPSSSSRPGRRQASSRRGGAKHVVVHRMSGVGAFIPGRPRHISPLARRITPTMWLFGVSPQLLLRDFPRHTRGHAPSGEGARGDALELTGLGQSVEAMPRETLCAQIVVAQQVGQRHEVRHHLRSAESVTDTAHLLWSLLTSIASTDVVAMAARDGGLQSIGVDADRARPRHGCSDHLHEWPVGNAGGRRSDPTRGHPACVGVHEALRGGTTTRTSRSTCPRRVDGCHCEGLADLAEHGSG